MGTIYVCDKCKKQAGPEVPKQYGTAAPGGWINMTISISSPIYQSETYLICGTCIDTLGLGKKDNGKIVSTNPTAEALYDAIVDIVQGEIEAYERG